MAITHKAAGTAGAGNTSSITPTLPSTAADDVGVLLVSHANTDNSTTFTTPSGWMAQTQVNNDRATQVFHDVFAGSDSNPNVVASSSQGFIGNVAVFDGVDTSTPLDVAIASNTGNGLTMTAPTVTTVTNGCMILRLFVHERGYLSAHTSFSEGSISFNDYNNLGQDSSISLTYLEQTSAGATGTATAATTEGEGDWVAYTLALRPASPVTMTLEKTAYNADGYSPDSVFVDSGIDSSLGAGDTWQIVSGTVSSGTVEAFDYGDFKVTPASGSSTNITFDWAVLDADDSVQNVTGAVDNGAGLVRLTITGHGLVTDDGLFVQNVGGVSAADGIWEVTRIDDNTLDLQGSTFSGTYTSGGTAVEVGYATHTHTVADDGPAFSGTVPDIRIPVDRDMTAVAFSGYFTPAPTSYSSIGTALPSGLELDTTTGEISGTPSVVGTTSNVQIRGTDASGNGDTNTFDVVVTARKVVVPIRRT